MSEMDSARLGAGQEMGARGRDTEDNSQVGF